MKQLELIVAFVIAIAGAFVGLGLYLWLFDISTGKLKTSVSRSGAKIVADVTRFLGKRALLIAGLLVAGVVVVLAIRYFESLSELAKSLMRRGVPARPR